MKNSAAELVWQGQLALGDEPGVYGGAAFSGLAVELPVTLTSAGEAGTDSTTFVISTRDVRTYEPYRGHLVTVTLYEEGASTVLGTERIAGDGKHDHVDTKVKVDLTDRAFPAFVGVRIAVDTTVPPGLYDDFVVTELRNTSPKQAIAASLGFRV